MKVNANVDGENVSILSTNVSNGYSHQVFVTSAGEIKVSRKRIGIGDEVTIGTGVEDMALNYNVDYVDVYENQSIGMVGSSTTEHCTKPGVILSGGVGYCEIDDGVLTCGKSRYGLPFDIIYNGGVGGSKTSAIYNSMDAMISAVPSATWYWLQLGAGDMQNGSITPEITFYDYLIPMVKKSFNVGAKVIVVIPHTTSSANLTRINYVKEYERLCRNFASRYPDKVYVWSLFKYVSEPYGGVTPAQFLDPLDGVHLSVLGAWESGKAAEGMKKLLKIPPVFDPSPYKIPLNSSYDLTNLSGASLTFCTSSEGPLDEYQRKSIDITSTQTGQIYFRFDVPYVSGNYYKVLTEVEILTSGVRSVDCQARGLNSADIYSQIGGNTWDTVNTYVGDLPIGTKKYLITSKFYRTTITNPRIYTRFWSNSTGSKIRIRVLGIIKIF